MGWEVRQGDCVELMRALDPASVDAVVCDPPYHLTFMGRSWDHAPSPLESQAMHQAWATEALRVLKPGGHLLAFGGTRTYHRLVCAVEDAGFEIRDSIAWSHMKHVFCQCGSVPYSHDGEVPGVRQDVQSPAVPPEAVQEPVVQPEVQRPTAGPGVGDVRALGAVGLDGRFEGVGQGEDVGGEEPGVEGRRDLPPPEGELHAEDQVRSSAGQPSGDGPEGRVRDGAPASDGPAGGQTSGPGGGGPSPEPQSAGQQPDELGAVAVEWIAQGGGAWPGCPRCGEPLAPPFFGGPLIWKYGSGFPKSLDISKQLDRQAGATREVVAPPRWGENRKPNAQVPGQSASLVSTHDGSGAIGPHPGETAPATPEAERWDGWGTALKPAHEPVVVARKPLTGTVAANVLEHGVGGLNVDATRITGGGPKGEGGRLGAATGSSSVFNAGQHNAVDDSTGRWPANVVLDVQAAGLLDEQSGNLGKSAGTYGASGGSIYANGAGLPPRAMEPGSPVGFGDSGGASRFFYTAKASRGERNAGLEGLNGHPTVKPIALMRWLVRLVTPPGGLVLDCFCGSGTTGAAAVLEGFDFLGLEREQEYVEIANARIAHWAAQPVQLGLEGAA